MLDAVIIGSGPAGYACAIRVSQLGGKAVIIEKDSVGGICTNYGCIPKLSMHASARLLIKLKRASEFGIDIDRFSVNFEKIMQRKDRIVEISTKGLMKLLDSYGIEIKNGAGNIVSKNQIRIKETGETISAKNIMIATGSQPAAIPNVKGITSADMFRLKELPESLVVIGAGYIGVEFATTFSKFGSRVTIIEMADAILPQEDEDVADAMTKIMERSGIKIYTKTKVVESDGNNVKIETPEGKAEIFPNINVRVVKGEKVLVAVGRKPNIDQKELDSVGVKYDKKGIATNSRLQTNIRNIYAAGDVTGIAMLAHVAYLQGVVAGENMMGQDSEINYDLIPRVIFSTPEIASVGKTDKTCPVAKFPLVASGAARAFGTTEGFVKVCSCDGKLTSVSIVAENASDLIAEAVLAIKKGVSVEEIEKIMHAHPTLPEAFMEAVGAVTGKSLHMPRG